MVQHATRSFFGQFVQTTTCPNCGGRGTVIDDPCNKCHGSGRVKVKVDLELEIPKGVLGGQYLTLTGQGNVGERGGRRGDLMVVVEELRHDTFQREGYDLYLEMPVSFSVLALGGEMTVPTIYGESAKFKISAGSQSHTMFKLKKKGIPRPSGGTGDLYVRVFVQTPKKLDREGKELFERLQDWEKSMSKKPVKGKSK
jgi:molecular chaperone DnaJ